MFHFKKELVRYTSVKKGVCEKTEFNESSKGGLKLVKDNFLYHKNKTLPNENTYWECSKRRSGGGCKLKVLLYEHDQFLRQSGEHTHPPDPEKISVEKARAGMKRSAKESNATTNNIVAQKIAGRSQSVLAKLPKMETMRRGVRRQRAAHSDYPQYLTMMTDYSRYHNHDTLSQVPVTCSFDTITIERTEF